MKIGMRTVKTAFAVSLTIFISQILNLRSPFFAGISAIIAMQSSVAGSFKAGKNRMLGTVLGATLALVCSLISTRNPIVIGLGTVIIIHLCNVLKWKKSATIAAVVFLSITLNQEHGNRLNYSLYRTLDTFLGIIIATLVNYFISPPNFKNKVENSCNNILTESMDLIENFIWENKNIKDSELNNIRNNLKILDNHYDTLEEEMELNIYKFKKPKPLSNTYNSFRKIYENLNTLSKIDFNPIINRRNSQMLEKIYGKNIPSSDRKAMVELDIVFNYHLKTALEEIEKLMDILNHAI